MLIISTAGNKGCHNLLTPFIVTVDCHTSLSKIVGQGAVCWNFLKSWLLSDMVTVVIWSHDDRPKVLPAALMLVLSLSLCVEKVMYNVGLGGGYPC